MSYVGIDMKSYVQKAMLILLIFTLCETLTLPTVKLSQPPLFIVKSHNPWTQNLYLAKFSNQPTQNWLRNPWWLLSSGHSKDPTVVHFPLTLFTTTTQPSSHLISFKFHSNTQPSKSKKEIQSTKSGENMVVLCQKLGAPPKFLLPL